jgi:hypothetical protein
MAYTLVQSATGGLYFKDEASSSVGSVVMSLGWNVARGATNTVTVGTLPANAQIIAIHVHVPVVSNAGTTATVSVGTAGGSNTTFSAAQDVKSAIGNFSQAATAGWAPSTSSQSISCTYTETGTASTGGTISVDITYRVL